MDQTDTELRLNKDQINKLTSMLNTEKKQGTIERVFEWIDVVLGKGTLLLLWCLEILGVLWIHRTYNWFVEAIELLKKADTLEAMQRAVAMVTAVKTAAESTNGIIIAFCAGLPGVIGAIKAARKIFKERNAAEVESDG